MILDHLDGNHLACVHGFALDHLAEGAGAQLVENKEPARKARCVFCESQAELGHSLRRQLLGTRESTTARAARTFDREAGPRCR
jgi:hypothetical protein